MTDSVELVQESWKKIAPAGERLVTTFYETLFDLAPEVRPLFPEEMKQQKKKLFDTLNFAVKGLNDLSSLFLELRDLGKRHNSYGAKPEHYAVVGQALIAAIKEELGSDCNQEVEEAWNEIYSIMATQMIYEYQPDG